MLSLMNTLMSIAEEEKRKHPSGGSKKIAALFASVKNAAERSLQVQHHTHSLHWLHTNVREISHSATQQGII